METNEVKFRHLGQYRQDPTTGALVTLADARLDAACLKTLFKKGVMGEGKLANHCRWGLKDDVWQRCVRRLLEWRMVEILPAYYGDSRRVALTGEGRVHAQDLCCREQIEQNDQAEKALRDRLDAEQGFGQ